MNERIARDTSVASRLRALRPDFALSVESAALLRRMGIDSEPVRCTAGLPAMRASVWLGPVKLEVAIGLAEWCAAWLDEGARLAFASIDPAYLCALFDRDMNARHLGVGRYGLTRWHAYEVGRVTRDGWCAAVFGNDGMTFMLRSGPATLRRVIRSQITGYPLAERIGAIPTVVTLRVGRSRLPKRLLSQLAAGDLLLVHQLEWTASVGCRRLGQFSIEGGLWTMESIDDHYADDQRHASDVSMTDETDLLNDDPPSGENGLSVEQLPVDMEFVLDTVTLTFADLKTLDVGATFPIDGKPRACAFGVEPDDGLSDEDVECEGADAKIRSAYRVQIRANGRHIADGELVAIGDTVAVQIVRIGRAA